MYFTAGSVFHKDNWEKYVDFHKYLEYVLIEILKITNGLVSRYILM